LSNTQTAGKMTTTFRVGIYTCDLTYGLDGELSAQWSPAVPRRLAGWEMAAYRLGRDTLLCEVSKAIGGAVRVLEEA
jgi:hypothetical protein